MKFYLQVFYLLLVVLGSSIVAQTGNADFEITKLELVKSGRKSTKVFNYKKDRGSIAVWVHYRVRNIGPGGNLKIVVSGKGPGKAFISEKKFRTPIKRGKHGHTGRNYYLKIVKLVKGKEKQIFNPKEAEGKYELEAKIIFHDKEVVKKTSFTIDNRETKISAGNADFEITKLELVRSARKPAKVFHYKKDRGSIAVWVHYRVRNIGPGGNLTIVVSGKGPGKAFIAEKKFETPIKQGRYGHTGRNYYLKIVKLVRGKEKQIFSSREAKGKYKLEAKIIFHDRVVSKSATFKIK